MKQRIDYIDRMKGLAIFLVVMGHIYGMAFAQSDDVAYRVISSFHMPLFTLKCTFMGKKKYITITA